MFAGLYSRWTSPGSDESIYTAAILTRDAAPEVAHIHDRMPFVLHPAAWNAWIDPSIKTRELIDDILVVHAVMELKTYKISARVNSPGNDDPAILDPSLD